MGISFVDNSASQEMSVALTQGALSLNSDDFIPSDIEAEKSRAHKSAQEMEASELLDKGQGKRFTNDVLKPFFSKLAEAGVAVGKQNDAKVQKDLDKLAGDKESFEDMVEIRNRPDMIRSAKRAGQQGSGSNSSFSGKSSQEEVMAMLKEYAAALTQYASSQTPELAQRLKELRERLLGKGISDANLKNLEASLRQGGKADLAEALKESLVMQMLSADNLIDQTVQKRRIADLLRGMNPAEAKELLGKARHQAMQEMRGFSLEGLENALIKATHLQDGDFGDALKFINLAEKVGVNYSEWLRKEWEQKKDNHGLNFLDVPHSVAGNAVDTNSDNPQSQKHGYEYEKKDESEVLLNRLRALYMQRALKGDMLTHLKTEFKMRKLKNGLYKLGIFTQDLEEKVQREAEVVAKIKIIEMLKEALIERASFYELAGPAHKLVERKIKGLLKNTERLGMPISGQEFNLMRDNANRRIFDLSLRELEDVRNRRVVKDTPKLEKKEKLLLKLLFRLKDESKIEDSVPGSC
jgi:hypothetical protein